MFKDVIGAYLTTNSGDSQIYDYFSCIYSIFWINLALLYSSDFLTSSQTFINIYSLSNEDLFSIIYFSVLVSFYD
jgi:hypothetical protein